MAVEDQILRLYEDDNAFADYIGVETYRSIRDQDKSALNRLRNSIHMSNVYGDDAEHIFNGYEEYSKGKGFTGDGDLDSRQIHDSLKQGWKDRHTTDSLYEGYKSAAKSGWLNYEEGWLDQYQTSPSVRDQTFSLSKEIESLKTNIDKEQDSTKKRLMQSELRKNQLALRVQTIGRARAAEERLNLDIERQGLRFSEELLKLKAAEGLEGKIQETGVVSLSQLILESMVSQGPGAPLSLAAGAVGGPVGLGASAATVAFGQEVAAGVREELAALNIDFTNLETLDQQIADKKDEINAAYVKAGKKAIPVALAAMIGGKDFGGSTLISAGARDLAAQTTIDAMGETLGELWSTGDVDAANVYMEVIAGAGSNVAEFGVKSTSTLIGDKMRQIATHEDGSMNTSEDWEQIGQAITDEEVESLGLNPFEESALIMAKGGDKNAQDAIAQIIEDGKDIRIEEPVQPFTESLAAAIERGGQSVDNALKKLASISTRIGDISKKAKTRIERIDFDTTEMINDGVRKTDPFIDSVNRAIRGLSPEQKDELRVAIFNRDEATLKKFGINNIDQLKEFFKARADQFPEINEFQIPNYFPRIVKDLDGLMDFFSKQTDGPFAAAIKQAEDQKGGRLTDRERKVAINKVLKSIDKGSKPGFLKARTIEKMTPELLKFYKDPLETLRIYNDRSANLIAKRQFLGENIFDPENVDTDPEINTEAIAKYIDEDLPSLTKAEELELAKLINSRLKFSRGQGTFQKIVNAYKTGVALKYVSGLRTIMMQSADFAMNWYSNGTRDFVSNLATRQKYINRFGEEVKAGLEDSGLDTIDQDLNEALKTRANAVQFILVGLRKMDFAMKQNLLSTTSKRWARLAKNSPQQIKGELMQMFDDEAFVNKVVKDLKNRKLTSDLSFAFFVKLSEYHPTGISQQTKFYIDNPKTRALFVLKSFAFKRFDFIYREALRDINQGMTQSLAGAARQDFSQVKAGGIQLGSALGRMSKILATMYVFETFVEMMYYQLTPDQEDDERKFLDTYLDNVAGIVPFFNVWDFKRGLERGKIWEGLVAGAEPPSPLGADPLGELIESFSENKPYNWDELESEIPWIGAFLDDGEKNRQSGNLFQ